MGQISHGLNKLVTNLTDKEYDDNEQETSETKTEVFALKTEVFAYASRSKAKAKPRRPSTTYSSSRTVPILERKSTFKKQHKSPVITDAKSLYDALERGMNLQLEI